MQKVVEEEEDYEEEDEEKKKERGGCGKPASVLQLLSGGPSAVIRSLFILDGGVVVLAGFGHHEAPVCPLNRLGGVLNRP